MAGFTWNNPFGALGNVASGVADNASFLNNLGRSVVSDYTRPVESPSVAVVASDTDTRAPVDESQAQLGGTDSQARAEAQAQAQRQASLSDYLRRISTTRDQGLQGIGDDYNREVSGANSQRGRAMEDFNTKETDTTLAKDRALGQVNTNARTLADRVRRIIGQASGSGSSAYQFEAPNAIARDASKNRTGVVEDFGANFRDLDTSKKRAESDFEELLRSIDEQKNTRERDFRAALLEKEQGALQEVGDTAGVNERQAQLDGLFNQYRTPYSVKPVEVKTPNLRDYTVDRSAITANNTQGQDPYSPFQSIRKKFEDSL